jgi:hypothetical protein
MIQWAQQGPYQLSLPTMDDGWTWNTFPFGFGSFVSQLANCSCCFTHLVLPRCFSFQFGKFFLYKKIGKNFPKKKAKDGKKLINLMLRKTQITHIFPNFFGWKFDNTKIVLVAPAFLLTWISIEYSNQNKLTKRPMGLYLPNDHTF